jgi:KDO2-lipid IV(A) lauroyltransferase
MTRLAERIEFFAGRAFVRAIGLLPWSFVHAIGAAVGAAAYAIDARHRHVALTNVAAALPERSPGEHRAIVRGAFRHFGVFLFELMKFSRLSPAEMQRRFIWEGEGDLRAGYAGGRGVLLMGAHFGCWEIHALAHGVQFEPIGMMARALDRPGLNRLLEWIRGRTGNFVIYRQGTIRRVLRALQDRKGVAVLIDQHVHERDAIVVDFFGRPAATTSMLAAIALRTGAAVVPVFAMPVGPGRYRAIYGEIIEPSPGLEGPEAARALTARCTAVLERQIREHPHLWLWMHQRWRSACGPREVPEGSEAEPSRRAPAHGGGAPCAARSAGDKAVGDGR